MGNHARASQMMTKPESYVSVEWKLFNISFNLFSTRKSWTTIRNVSYLISKERYYKWTISFQHLSYLELSSNHKFVSKI